MQLPLDEIEDAIHTGILPNCNSQLDNSFFNPSTLVEAERTLPFLTPQRADQVASALIALHQPGRQFTQAILNHRLLQSSLVTLFIRNKIKSNFSSSCTCNVTLLLASPDVDWHLAASVKPNTDTQHQQQGQRGGEEEEEEEEEEEKAKAKAKGARMERKAKGKAKHEEPKSVWTLLSAAAKAVLSRQVTLDDWGHSLSDLFLLPALAPVNQVRCMLLLLAVAPVTPNTVADLTVIASSGRHIWLADVVLTNGEGDMYHELISFLAKDGRCDDLLVLLVRRIIRCSNLHWMHQAERLTSVALDCNSLALTAALVTQVNRCISSSSSSSSSSSPSPGQVDLVNRLVFSLLGCLQSCPTPDRSSCLLGLSDVDDERVKQAREDQAETLIHLTEHTQHTHSHKEPGQHLFSPCDIRLLASVCRQSNRLSHYLSQRMQDACVRDEGPAIASVLAQALPPDAKVDANLPLNATSLTAYAYSLPEVTSTFANRLVAAASRPELLYYVTQVAITLAKIPPGPSASPAAASSSSSVLASSSSSSQYSPYSSTTTTTTSTTTTITTSILPHLLDIVAFGVNSEDEKVVSLVPNILLSLLETHKVQVITTALSQWTGLVTNLVRRISDLSTLDKLIAVACDIKDFVPFAPHVLVEYLVRWPSGSTSTYRLIRVSSSSNKSSNDPSNWPILSVHARMSEAERKLLLRLHSNFQSCLKFTGMV